MLFKILQGPSSRIDTTTTPLHEGYAYFTPDTAGFYIDAQVNGVLTRVQVNPDQVLQAVRNETTYQDIASATERGCAVLCVDGSVVYQLANLNTSTKTALFISMYEVDSDSVAHIRAWTVMEEDDGTTTWERHSKVTAEAVVDAVTEQNTSADQKFWRGTQAEYDAIEDKDDSVLYIVTDEDEGSTVVVGDMKAEFYDADLAVKDAGGIAAFVQAKVDGVTVSSLGAAVADHTHTASEVGADASGAAAQALTDAKEYADAQIATRAPQYLYGVKDLEEGVSDLASGTLYFVYEAGEITFSIGGAQYTAKECMTWEEWINSNYNTAGIGSTYDKYVTAGGYMLLGSDDECVFLTDEIVSGSSFPDPIEYFTLTIDLTGCCDSEGASLDGQCLNLIGKNYITFEQFACRRESQNLINATWHIGSTWFLVGIRKGDYTAAITEPGDSYLSIDNGGRYSISTEYWVS